MNMSPLCASNRLVKALASGQAFALTDLVHDLFIFGLVR